MDSFTFSLPTLEKQASPSPSHSPVTDAADEVLPSDRAEKLKEEGNNAFKAKEYGTAIDRYTEAIGASPDLSV